VSTLGVGPHGESVIAGVFQQAIDFGDQPLSSPFGDTTDFGKGTLFIAKLSEAGATAWSRGFPSSAPVNYPQLAVDHQGNTVLTVPASNPGITVDFGGGSVGPGTLVAKLDPAGDLIWSRAYLKDDLQPYQVAIGLDLNDNILLWSVANIGAGGYALELTKLSPQGEPLWSNVFPVQGWSGVMSFLVEFGATVVTDAQGAITVTTNGFALQGAPSSVDFGSGPLVIPSGGGNAYVAKFDPDGKLIYSRLLAVSSSIGDGPLKSTTLALGAAGQLFITTTFGAPVDVGNGTLLPPAGSYKSLLIAELDASGNSLWSRLVGENVYSEGLAVTPAGDLVIGGAFLGSIDFGGGAVHTDTHKPFIARLRGATGEYASSQVFEGDAAIELLAASGDGDVIAALQLENSVDFCGNVLESAGRKDVALAKLTP
jgi:hypothetical protein